MQNVTYRLHLSGIQISGFNWVKKNCWWPVCSYITRCIFSVELLWTCSCVVKWFVAFPRVITKHSFSIHRCTEVFGCQLFFGFSLSKTLFLLSCCLSAAFVESCASTSNGNNHLGNCSQLSQKRIQWQQHNLCKMSLFQTKCFIKYYILKILLLYLITVINLDWCSSMFNMILKAFSWVVLRWSK